MAHATNLTKCLAILAPFALTGTAPALADTARPAGATDFLKALEGRWEGGGDVLVRTNRSPLKVRCEVDVEADAPSFNLAGDCGALFVKRPIDVTLEKTGDAYTGVYTGSRSGPAKLAGARVDDSLSLTVTWAREINGDETAQMTLIKESDDAMRLITEDLDPETRKTVVTSDIALTRVD